MQCFIKMNCIWRTAISSDLEVTFERKWFYKRVQMNGSTDFNETLKSVYIIRNHVHKFIYSVKSNHRTEMYFLFWMLIIQYLGILFIIKSDFLLEYIVTYLGMTREGVWIGELDLLTTCIHHSELQVIIALSLISTLYKSLHAKFFPSLLCLQHPFPSHGF
jgi:hypothetical protein